MPGNRDVSPANKLNAVKEYLDGKGSMRDIAKRYNVNKNSLGNWISKYKAFGDNAFIRTGHNAKYEYGGWIRPLERRFKPPSAEQRATYYSTSCIIKLHALSMTLLL